METAPFSVKPTSVFNRIAVDDLANDFVHGILALVIVVELGNFCQTIIYATPTLQREALNRFITFHRVRTLRFLHEPITSRFKSNRLLHQMSRNYNSFRNKDCFHLSVACFVALALIGIEFVVIFVTTPIFTPITAGATTFDAKLGVTENAPRTRDVKPGCDDFFVPARGIHKASAVLKCVSTSSSETSGIELKDSISMTNSINDNIHSFSIRSKTSSNMTTAKLVISIRSIGQGELEMAPFRADIDRDATIAVFKAIAEGTLNRPLPSFESNLISYSVEVGAETVIYEEESLGEPYDRLTSALISRLRSMDVVLNTTSAPWVFVESRTYEERPNIVVSIMVSNRVPQGVVAIIAVLLVFLRILANARFSSFDDVSYVIMKDIIRDDCALGPLAGNNRTVPESIHLRSSICHRSMLCEAVKNTDQRMDSPIENETNLPTTSISN
ncbi:unnamed protein product [Agarophyton chilense]